MSVKIKAETIVTGHANADFDCFAAIVAAGKLYPGAQLVFPGSQEKNLRRFFLQSATYMFNFTMAKDIDPKSVKKVVVVDTRQKSRVPHIKDILKRDDVEIHVYDHHPDTDEDLPADFSMVKSWGSCAAIITKEIQAKGLELTGEEATVIGLGIYEDTGSFTFNSTTVHDLEAAAWLLSQGMDLDALSNVLTRDLTAEQVSLLNALLTSATTHDINGVEIAIAEASTQEYVGDFSLLVHKMMDIEQVRVLFAIGRMQDRIHIVARSRTDEVDVSRICEHFGGGGHAFAASASVKNRTLMEVKDELFALLYAIINPNRTMADLMNSPAKTVTRTTTLGQASEMMTRFSLKTVPVVEPKTGEYLGVLDHETTDKGVAHGLGKVEVHEYMRNADTLSPDAGLNDAMNVILGGNRQRLVPVVDADKQVRGVFSRTDLINILVEEPARIPDRLKPGRKRDRNIKNLMRERLPKNFVTLLNKIGKVADRKGYTVYAVGGFVRDILLSKPNFDLDLVVEGNGVAFAEELANELGGRMKSHKKFKTAVLILEDGQRVDVATARLEYYEYPAALPTVELSSIKMDLFRRDFTINALAVHLNAKTFGRLVDFFGAQRDIREKVIRVLHSLSFVEDPTRILRAIRFEQRYDFSIGGQTDKLIKNAVRMDFFQQLSGSRLFNELKLIFMEENALSCVRRLNNYGLLKNIHPDLVPDTRRWRLLEEVSKVLAWYHLLFLEKEPEPWMLYLMALCSGFDEKQMEQLTTRLSFTKRDHKEFITLREAVRHGLQKINHWQWSEGPQSELWFILSDLPLEGALYLMARTPREDVRKNISQYLTQQTDAKIEVDGTDLKKLGVAPGPIYSEILKKVTAAKIDGTAGCKTDQLEYVKKLVRELPENTQDD